MARKGTVMGAAPMDAMRATGDRIALCWQAGLDRASGAAGVAAVQRKRLAALVRHARAASPLFRELYRDLPDAPPLETLPVTRRAALMERFDAWVTDPAVTLAAARAFVADRTRVGDRLLGRYAVWTSSGTSGEEGLFVQDEQALAVYDTLLALQLASPDLAAACVAGLLDGGRAALIAATGGHFASVASWERIRRAHPSLLASVFPVTDPLDVLVAKLDGFAPAFIASYPTLLWLLSDERRAGRLHVAPSLVWAGGETIAPAMRDALARAFGCPVIDEYGASECLSIAFGCREHWLHLNADWVILEPVDAEGRPVPRGQRSHTVLLTNLANRVQPIVRYDLGDSVLMRAGPCPCGSPLPALRVEGRSDDVVVLRDRERVVRIAPMALSTIVEEATGVHRFQVIQCGPNALRLRFACREPAQREQAFRSAVASLRAYLATLGASGTRINVDHRPPQPDARSGKLRQVVVEAKAGGRAA
jgi:phenylacetate-CoA ligase